MQAIASKAGSYQFGWVLAAETSLDQSAHLPHVGTALRFGFQPCHDFAHIAYRYCAGFSHRLLDKVIQFGGTEGLRKVRLDNPQFVFFLRDEIRATCVTVLADGFTTLFHHFVQHHQHGGIVHFDARIHFLLLNRGKNQTNHAKLRFFVRSHGGFHVFGDLCLEAHNQYIRTRRLRSREMRFRLRFTAAARIRLRTEVGFS